MHKTAFIGHRRILQNNLAEELNLTIEKQIQSGCTHFIVGSHSRIKAEQGKNPVFISNSSTP